MYPKTLTKRQITYLKRKYNIDRFLGICASVMKILDHNREHGIISF